MPPEPPGEPLGVWRRVQLREATILRLNAQAFVVTQGTEAIIDHAFGDRRLTKMALTKLAGSLPAAIAYYGENPSPPLLLIEAEGPGEEILAGIDGLAEVCSPETNLILLGGINDIDFYRAIKQLGVAEYLVNPARPLRLVEAVTSLFSEVGKGPQGSVIGFLGAKGGCGNTTLAFNTAFALSRLTEADVVMIDFDLPFGAVDLGMNIESPHGIRNVLGDPERVDESFLQRFTAKYNDRLHLLSAPTALDIDSEVAQRALEATVEAIKRQARYIVLDLPHTWSEWLRLALQLSDEVVLVALPDLASIRNARNLLDYFAGSRALDRAPHLAVNRIGLARKSEVAVKDFSQTVGQTVGYEILEDSDLFGRAAAQGVMLEEVNHRAKAAETIRRLAAAVGHVETRVVRRRGWSLPGLPFLGRRKANGQGNGGGAHGAADGGKTKDKDAAEFKIKVSSVRVNDE